MLWNSNANSRTVNCSKNFIRNHNSEGANRKNQFFLYAFEEKWRFNSGLLNNSSLTVFVRSNHEEALQLVIVLMILSRSSRLDISNYYYKRPSIQKIDSSSSINKLVVCSEYSRRSSKIPLRYFWSRGVEAVIQDWFNFNSIQLETLSSSKIVLDSGIHGIYAISANI